jgi:DNA-binding response OmpR family regulator
MPEVTQEPAVQASQVGILVLDDDSRSQGALRQILDAEGWRVRVVPDPRLMLTELSTGEWSLVIANVALTSVTGPAFITLKELSSVSAEEGARIRVLFLIPELAGAEFAQVLERNRLPYVARPFHLHDFLEKISDLLIEIKAIDAPIRQVRYEFGEKRKKKAKAGGRATSMFASRDSYSYSEEEIAAYEQAESEELQKKKRKRNIFDLGNPHNE